MELFKKLFCCHGWEVIVTKNYIDAVVMILSCKKCGKIKRIVT